MPANSYVARQAFNYTDRYEGGEQRITITAGQHVDGSHGAVRDHPDLFEPAGHALIRQHHANARNVEPGFGDRGNEPPPLASPDRRTANDAFTDALRTLERHVADDSLSVRAADRLDDLIRNRDDFGWDAEYLAAVGDLQYARAFGKVLRYGDSAMLRMQPGEQQAFARVNRAEETRALYAGTAAAGGYALPISVDPSIVLTSDGAVNVIRELAQVRTISTHELRLTTSAGTTAQFQAEGAEAPDNSPTLGQPILTPKRATCFVPFSYEVGQDWSTLLEELARLMADAKGVLEATKFLLGSGTDEPVGILSVGTAGALTTAQRVTSTGAGAVAVGDIWAIKAALASTRFYGNSVWVANPARLDAIYRFVGGNSTEPPLMDSRDGSLAGRPVRELTTMATAVTTGSKYIVLGDWRNYVVADRIGFSIELVQNLLGPNQRPTGMRGAYGFWRVDGRTANPAAFRYGEAS